MPSAVWEWFSKEKDKSGKVLKAKCKKCPAVLKFYSSTTNMHSHVKKCHGVDLQPLPPKGGRTKRSFEFSKSMEDEEDDADGDLSEVEVTTPSKMPRMTSESSGSEGSSGQGHSGSKTVTSPLMKCVNNMTAFAPGGVRDAQCNNALLYMIMKDGMPVCTPEKSGFRLFINTLQPLYKVPSEPTVTRMLEEKYHRLRGLVGKMISQAEFITLTADVWTQKGTMRSYLGMTAHFSIDANNYSFELGARHMSERKTSENLKAALKSMCDDWQIAIERVRIIVTDGGANIKGAAKDLFGNEKHISCVSHLFNGIGQKVIGNVAHAALLPSEIESDRNTVQGDREDEDVSDEAIEAEEAAACPGSVREIIVKVKKIVRFFRQSEVATSMLVELQQKDLDIPESKCLKLIQEVRTRWNSCFDMLERYLKLAGFVERVLLEVTRRKGSTKSKPPSILSADEEEVAREVKDLLSPLNRATKELSGERYCTLSKVIPVIRNLRKDTESFLPTTPVAFNLKEELLTHLRRNFGMVEEVKLFTTATLLDPRFKKLAFYKDNLTQRRAFDAVAHLGNLVRGRMRSSALAAAEAQQARQSVSQGEERPADDFWGDFDQEVEETAATARPGEDIGNGLPVQLQMYLSTPPVNRVANPNPLEAWQSLRNEYKDVYSVAKEYLSLLATSVPSERLFSHAGRIGNDLRNRLTGKHLEMYVFLHSCPDELWFRN